MTTEELLAVLDLPEEEQLKAVATLAWHRRKESEILADFHREYKSGYMETSLADLAFRLRDEAVQNNLRGYPSGFMEPQRMVWVYVIQPAKLLENGRLPDGKGLAGWWEYYSQPIHWIIAALIAKNLSKEKENGTST